jgi:hypothetical protein
MFGYANAMLALYAVPFIALSALASVIFLLVPKIRPYVLEVSVAPVAFGFCSIAGTIGVLLIADYADVRIPLFDEPVVGTTRWAVSLLVYSAFGLVGAWFSIRVVKRLKETLFVAFPPLRRFLCRAQL